MAYFEWANDLVIDHGPIDEDHKKLVQLVNDLHTATTDGSGQAIVGGVLKALVDYTHYHLNREENLMAEAGFPDLEEHKLGHQRFIQELRGLQDKFENGSITVAAQLSTVLRDWLSLHIRRDDKELLVFINKKKRSDKAALARRKLIRAL